MPEIRQHHDAQARGSATHHAMSCAKVLLGWGLLALVRPSEVLAESRDLDASRLPLPSASILVIPETYRALSLPEIKAFPANDFRPRGPSILDKEPRLVGEEAPMLRGTTVWQRLQDYRSRDRVRLLTLWETGGGTVSLQAGKKGEPSLQWTSRLMNRGGATRGVLDQLFKATMAGASRRLGIAPHDAGPPHAPNGQSAPSQAKLPGPPVPAR